LSNDVATDFLKKLDEKILKITRFPFIGTPVEGYKLVRSVLISKHNKMYYRIEETSIVIINMFDTRMDPKKNPFKNKE
jgi:plasmid stabilization system protein ParE